MFCDIIALLRGDRKFEFGALLYINLFRMQRKVAGKYLNENKCFLFCKGCFTTL